MIVAWEAAHRSVSSHQGRYEMREIVNALLYQGRTGCQWDLLPHDLPPGGAVTYRLRQVARRRHRPDHPRPAALTGAGEGAAKSGPSLVVLDTQSMHAAAGVPAESTGCDAAKKVPGRKRGLAQHMTGGELTLGAVLARLEEREREIAAQAETTGEQIEQLTARLDELGRAAEEIRITRKTLLELPDPQPPAPPAPKLPDHPAYQQILAVFTAADAPLRARQVCEAMDMEIASNTINNTRLKLKRLTERGILVETGQGLFTQSRP
ncbi:transposase [Streptomyces lincolnensis]|uniref:transposase n=1 Tax=Streptomyces lincolnensis TaxID=1915 RepID=UPI001E4BB58B|nr:transposase [Streptomyces lincolnensis]